MLTVGQFYARTRWGDGWNVLRLNGSRHRGHDIKAPRGQQVPALHGGKVHKLGYSSVLGYYVVVRLSAFTFDFYCHLIVGTRPTVGVVLNQGDSVGAIAGAGDDPGSAWTGPHLHYGAGPLASSVTSGLTYNATKRISDALTTFAATNPSPLPGSRRNTMSTLFNHAGKNLWALAGDSPGTPANWLETADKTFADQLARQHGDAASLSTQSWANWKAAYLAPLKTDAPDASVSVDLAPVLAAIAARPTEFTVQPK